MSKPILEQDECSPDSMETFEEQFIKIVGVSLYDFKRNDNTMRIDDEGMYSTIYFNQKYAVTISADFPYYGLYLLQDQKAYIERLIDKINGMLK